MKIMSQQIILVVWILEIHDKVLQTSFLGVWTSLQLAGQRMPATSGCTNPASCNHAPEFVVGTHFGEGGISPAHNPLGSRWSVSRYDPVFSLSSDTA